MGLVTFMVYLRVRLPLLLRVIVVCVRSWLLHILLLVVLYWLFLNRAKGLWPSRRMGLFKRLSTRRVLRVWKILGLIALRASWSRGRTGT